MRTSIADNRKEIIRIFETNPLAHTRTYEIFGHDIVITGMILTSSLTIKVMCPASE